MGRFFSVVAVVNILCMAGLLAGCSHSQAVNTAPAAGPTPAIVVLSPAPVDDLEIGSTLGFTGTAQDSGANAITGDTVTYQSSNTAVLTISDNGVACAGSWNSLSAPTICTPGPVGTAQVTAVAEGISSPPTTVHVHQHIDSISVSPVSSQPPPSGTGQCFSAGDPLLQRPAQSFNYQATVFSRGADITSTVGAIDWRAVDSSVVTLKTATISAPIAGLLTGQVQAVAGVPGVTTIFANVDGTTSAPFPFVTCPVQSIVLTADNAGSNSVQVASGASQAITATITDTQNNVITGNFLTWCSSDPGSVAVGTLNCSTGTSTALTATAQSPGGGGSIIASCTPPNCNVGMVPARPIYPPAPVTMTIAGPATGAISTVALIASTGCGTLDGCLSNIGSVSSNSGGGATSPANAISVVTTLPATPNSLVMDPKGSRAYLGTDRGNLGAKGVMVFDPSTGATAQFTSATGKVLAVSPDGTVAVLSDTIETPNQVYVFTCAGAGSGTCGSTSSVALNITGATAAAFSPDGLKAFIVAGSTLYIYSPISALQTISLTNPASAVSFLANGAFAYLTGGSPAITAMRTCDGGVADSVATPGIPMFIKALPDGAHLLAVDSPNIDIVDVTGGPTTTINCTSALSDSLTRVNLAQGNFIPTQLIISLDGAKAYLLTSNRGGVLVFDVRSQTTSSIQLAGNVLPLRAALSLNGATLFVAASDNAVHVLNTITANDVQQLPILTDLTNLQSGLCSNVAFPIQTTLQITAAAQTGTNTTYTYTLTSGQGLQLDASILINGLGNLGNNGTFTIAALGPGTFTVVNPSGATATGQTGTGSLAFNCNPDLIAVEP